MNRTFPARTREAQRAATRVLRRPPRPAPRTGPSRGLGPFEFTFADDGVEIDWGTVVIAETIILPGGSWTVDLSATAYVATTTPDVDDIYTLTVGRAPSTVVGADSGNEAIQGLRPLVASGSLFGVTGSVEVFAAYGVPAVSPGVYMTGVLTVSARPS